MRFVLAGMLLVSLGCSYDYGRRVNGPAFLGYGWDSGLAKGSAMEGGTASGYTGQPDWVSVNCYAMLAKLAVGIVAAGVAVKLGDTPEKLAGIGLVSAGLLLAVPNCSALVRYSNEPKPTSAESVPEVEFQVGAPR